MARTAARLPGGLRLSDYLGIGVIARVYPHEAILDALHRTGRGSVRRRALPADVMMYYVIAMALFRQVSTREVLQCLMDVLRWVTPQLTARVSGRSSISRARSRLGPEPFAALRETCVRPLATPSTAGAWYRGHRVVAIDGLTLTLPDEAGNREFFGVPGAPDGSPALPRVRVAVLVELGTRAPLAWCGGPVSVSQADQAERLVPCLKAGMLVLADHSWCGHPLWSMARERGADLLWRARSTMTFPVRRHLPDGSWESVFAGPGRDTCTVRALTCILPGSEEHDTLITTLLDHEQAPAAELAVLYHRRREFGPACDEVGTHMLGPGAMLRSKTPELALQELEGLMLAHYAVRSLIHEAHWRVCKDPDGRFSV